MNCYQEKRLRVNMGLKKLRQKVKEQQEKVGEKVCLPSLEIIQEPLFIYIHIAR